MTRTSESPEAISARLYRYDQVSDRLDGLEQIDEQKLIDYQNNGFLAVENAVPVDMVLQAIEAIREILFIDSKGAKIQFVRPVSELNTDEEREFAVRKIDSYVECDERLKAIACYPGILAIAERILGEKPKLVQDMALLKPPFGGGEKPWHQDMAYGNLAYDKPVVGVWIALDEAELDNGCMHVIPGSHAEGATPHYAIRDWQLCDTHVSVERDVAVPLKPGGLMFFHGLLRHGTPFNLSDKRRRALQFHYAGESAEKLRPREYKRFFTNEMTGAEC